MSTLKGEDKGPIKWCNNAFVCYEFELENVIDYLHLIVE